MISSDGAWAAFTSVDPNLVAGDTNDKWDVFYLIQNANDADVTVNYLRPTPLAPIVKVYTVPANSR